MSRCKAIAVALSLAALASFEVQQVLASCACVCQGTSGVPSSVDVTDATGGCDSEFDYTYEVHFATNDDNCGGGVGGSASAYPSSSFSDNVVDSGPTKHSISPSSFTISGAGETETFTVTGQLDTSTQDGVSATQVIDTAGPTCDTGVLSVSIVHDPNCP